LRAKRRASLGVAIQQQVRRKPASFMADPIRGGGLAACLWAILPAVRHLLARLADTLPRKSNQVYP
jgi:hypothetical protein